MRIVKTISISRVKKNVDTLLKLLLTHKEITVVNNNKTRFIVLNPNREAIAQELGYTDYRKGNILLIILAVVGILAALVGGYFYWSSKPKSLLLPTLTPNNETLTPGEAKKTPPLSDPKEENRKVCEIDKEYQNTAVTPIDCQCPQGYKLTTVSMSFGPCPEPKMHDCPATVVKCAKN